MIGLFDGINDTNQLLTLIPLNHRINKSSTANVSLQQIYRAASGEFHAADYLQPYQHRLVDASLALYRLHCQSGRVDRDIPEAYAVAGALAGADDPATRLVLFDFIRL